MNFKKILRSSLAALSVWTMLGTDAFASEYALGTFFSSDADTQLQFYRSDDMIHMDHLGASDDVSGRDPSIRFRNGVFYLCLVEPLESGNTFKIMRSNDLINWTSTSFDVVERFGKYSAIWAPDLFIDEDGSAYVYFARQKGEMRREKLFDIYVSRASSIEEMKFEPARKVELAGYESVIDAHVCRTGGQYYMIVKDEKLHTNNDNKSPHLFKSTLPDRDFVEVEDWALSAVRGCEGFSVATVGDLMYIYADNYSGKYDALPRSHYTVWITDDIERGEFSAEYVESVRGLRHGSVIVLGDDTINDVLEQLPAQRSTEEIPTREIEIEREDYGTGKRREIEIEKFAPAPRVIYRVPVKMKVKVERLVNAYGVERVEFVLSSGASLEIDGILKRDNGGSADKTIRIDWKRDGWTLAAK